MLIHGMIIIKKGKRRKKKQLTKFNQYNCTPVSYQINSWNTCIIIHFPVHSTPDKSSTGKSKSETPHGSLRVICIWRQRERICTCVNTGIHSLHHPYETSVQRKINLKDFLFCWCLSNRHFPKVSTQQVCPLSLSTHNFS